MLRWRLISFCVAVLFHAGAMPARGGIHAVGDGSDVWVVESSDAGELSILHRTSGTGSAALGRAGVPLHGRLAPQGLSAADGWLWMVYDNLNVQSIRWQPAQDMQTSGYARRPRWPLPRGATLRGFAAGHDTAWALLRVENAAMLQAIDAPPPPPSELDEDSVDPPTAAAPPAEAPTAETTPTETLLPVDRLLTCTLTGWRRLELPADWPDGAPAWLFNGGDDGPQLITARAADHATTLTRYLRAADGSWTAQTLDLPVTGRIQLARVKDHVVLAAPVGDEDLPRLKVFLLRGNEITTFDDLPIHQEDMRGWSLLDAGGPFPIGVLSWNAEPRYLLTQMDWRGKSTAAPLEQRQAQEWFFPLDMIVLLAALVLATLIMLALWRRDAAWSQLELSKGVVLAELSRRAIAGAIDLAPGLIAMALTFGWKNGQWEIYWPGYRTNDWSELLPKGGMIGIFFLHSFVTELFTARTLGKYLLGLRVTNLRGGAPNVWQVLIRNVMKMFELVAWFLLVLPAIAPHRQRLGDMAARTVVVMDEPKEQPVNEDEDEEE